MKKFLLVSALSLGLLSTGLIQAKDKVTPGTCYDLGAIFGQQKAQFFCGLGGDGGGAGIKQCSTKYKKHTINGCKSTVLDNIEEAYESVGCDNFEDYDTDFSKFLLVEELCEL